jgi:hypothetical protein
MTSEPVQWHPEDQLVIEVQYAARRLGMSFHDAVSFLVGMGIAKGNELGILAGRATEPMDPHELLARMSEYLFKGAQN